MDKLRYLLFIPAAFIASIILGVLGNWLGNFGIWIISGNEVLGWIFSGIASSVFFLGAISAVGSYFFGDSLAYIAGLIMVVSAFVYTKLDPKDMVF